MFRQLGWRLRLRQLTSPHHALFPDAQTTSKCNCKNRWFFHLLFFRSRPSKPNHRKGQNEKFINFALFVNSGVFSEENKHDSHWTFVPECPCEKFMNWPFFGLVCRGHSWFLTPFIRWNCLFLRRAELIGGRCQMGAFPNLSRYVPFCPRLSSFALLGARNGDKRGQMGTERDISGQIGKRPHLASTPV